MTTGLIIFGVLVLVGWVFMCFNVLLANQMGIKITLGKPAEEGIDSGLHWVWWPFQWIIRYTKEQMKISFMAKTIVTKKGKVSGYKQEIEPAEINILCTVYAYFDIEKLKKTVQRAPGRTAGEIGSRLVTYVKDTVRALGGRLPWRLINQERRCFSEWVLARLAFYQNGYPKVKDGEGEDFIHFDESDRGQITEQELEPFSPFVQFGLKDVSFVFEDMNFTDPELQKAISAPEKARLDAIATVRAAEAEKVKRTREGEGDAKARKAMITVIRESPDLEALLTLREMAQGTSNTILYQLPGAFEDRVRDMLGGNSFSEVLRKLSPEDQGTVKAVIESAIEKVSRSKGGQK